MELSFISLSLQKCPLGKRLGVNIAKDDIKNRFSLSSVPSEEVYKDFIKSFANIIQDFANEGYYFIFFPHIYSDLQAISDLLTSLPDKIVRERVTVERLHSDVELVKDTVKSYLACNLFIGMRFHSCLLSIKLNIPTLGIATTNKIRGLFNAMKIEKQAIDPLEIISKKRLTDIIDLKKIRPISNKEINDLIDVHFAEEGSLTQLRDFINKSVFSNN